MGDMEQIRDRDWSYCREQYGQEYTEAERSKKTEELLDFANMVFSMDYGPTDFASLLPKAYAAGRCGLPTHHMIKEEGRIRALIDTYPLTLRQQGACAAALQAVYVGTVSVHPGARGRGYMIELMRRAEEDARRQGCALMILDGDRHRYQHYGFERAGARYSFHIGRGNIRHCCARNYPKKELESPVFCFEEFGENSPHLDALYALYRRRNVTARSREDFLLCLQSYHAAAYVILRKGASVGYVCLSEDEKAVVEFEMEVLADTARFLCDLMQEFDMDPVSVNVGVDEQIKRTMLAEACDNFSISMSHQIKILDYEAVLSFLLGWKRRYSALAAGEYVIAVAGAQADGVERYLLSVTEEAVRVSRTQREADVVLEARELVRVLTTPLCFMGQQERCDKIKNAPAGWFPLPFYLPDADTF